MKTWIHGSIISRYPDNEQREIHTIYTQRGDEGYGNTEGTLSGNTLGTDITIWGKQN